MKNRVKKFISFIKELLSEINKIQWSKPKATTQITFVILITVTILSGILLFLDKIIFYIISMILYLRF